MRQAFHIFQKDLRYLWKEIVAYGFLLLMYGVTKPMLWPGSNVDSTMAGAVMVLQYLLPVTFFVLIVRAVQEERLVGVDQFWVTRPYRWSSLLLAKAMFLAAVVVVPFVLMQWWLLSRAGLGLLNSPAGMIRCLTMIALAAWLPFALIAAVTATVVEAFVVLIGMVVIWVTALAILFSSLDGRMSPPYSFEAMAVLFASLLIAVLVYQYARRQTKRSRIAFAVVAALFLTLLYGFSGTHLGAPIRALIRSRYPPAREPGLRLVTLPGPVPYVPYAERVIERSAPKGFVEVKLPVRLEGLEKGDKLHDVNVAYAIEGVGQRYVSPWQTANLGENVLSLAVPQSVVDRVEGHEAHLRMEFLAEKLRPRMPEVVRVSKSFDAPGQGRCVLVGADIPVCRYAYRVQVPTRIEARGTCEEGGKASGPVYANLQQMPGGSTVDPVVQEQLKLGKVCPGSEMTFSEYEPAGRFRLEMEVPSIDLGQYKAR